MPACLTIRWSHTAGETEDSFTDNQTKDRPERQSYLLTDLKAMATLHSQFKGDSAHSPIPR